jgi:2,4-dienoyl-CoA reductase-like NADH-dependent reductase (Old Yellow Enzyme family)
VVEALAGSGLDLLEISGGTYERAAMFDASSSTGRREAYFMDYAEKVRARAAMPLMLTGGFRSRRGMEEALQGGAVDVVGVARPLSLEPDLPKRLLSGEAEAARPFDISTPFSAINALVPTVWCQQQLQRMAEGRDPDPELSPWRSLLRYGKDAILGGRRVRRRGFSS